MTSLHSYLLTHTYFSAVVCFGLQFIHGNQSLKKAAFQQAHWCLSVKACLRIGQDQFKGNGEASHVDRKGPTGTPAGMEANDLKQTIENMISVF